MSKDRCSVIAAHSALLETVGTARWGTARLEQFFDIITAIQDAREGLSYSDRELTEVLMGLRYSEPGMIATRRRRKITSGREAVRRNKSGGGYIGESSRRAMVQDKSKMDV